MKGEITLADALERVTKSVRERSDGLADLKHVLRHNQRSSSIETLSDASFHRIYETLFAIVVTEQTAHASAKTTTLKSAAANRLTSCAGVLRLAVEVGIVSVGIKTVKALLDHFIETTYLPNGDICEPLALEYPKAMRAILSHPPHVAHLPKLEWDRTAKFCLEHLSTAQSENHGESASLGAATTFLSSRSSRSRLNNSLGSQPARGSSKQVTEEMAACLRLLTSAPNAPVTAMATEILWATIGFLQVNTATNLAHQDAFGILGNVLSWTKTEDIRLTRATTGQLVRLIRTYWGVRASGLKEMMIVFTHLQLYIKDQSLKVGSETLMADLHGLLEVLRSEYSKRQERDQLRLDDVRFGCEETARRQPGSLHSGVISLQCVGVRAEQSWTSVHMMAFIASVLYHNQAKANENDDDEEDEDDDHRRARKRQRTSDELDDLLSLATGGTTGSRITALQTLSFLLQRTAIPTAQLSKILAKSLLLSNDEHTTIASWSMIIVASCAYQLNSTDASLAAHWTSLWQLVCRSMTSAGTCRAACAVLCMILRIKLVPGSLVSELFQSLTVAFELSGPNILCDTALEFMRLTMVHAISTLPSSALVLGNSMIGWLLRRWLPSKFDDRSYASSCNLFNNADVVCTVSQYLGQSSHFGAPSGFPTWDVLGRSWIIAQKHDRLISYLLSLTQEQNHTHQATLSVSQDAATASIPKPSSEALIVNHLTNELARTAETWKQMVHDRPQGISLDIFSALCHFLSVSACFSYCTHFSNSRQQSQLQQHCRSLFKTTNVYVKNKTCGQDKVDNMLVCFSQNLWRSVNDDTTDDIGNSSTDCRHEICAAMTDAIASRTASQFIDDEADVEDMMDIGDSYESQESRRDRTQAGAVELVDDASITYSVHALRAAIPLYASIITTVTGSASHSRESDGVSTVVDDIVALPESSILASRVVLTRLPALVPDMTANDFETLLGHLTETFLESYTFERSEAAIGTVLDAMIGFKSFWVDTSNQSLAGLGLDTYEWCVSTALKAGILSPNVQKRISTLLLELCEVNTQYPQDDNVPSVRTSLFALLRRGAIAVQFHLAERISTIFGLFVLSAHEAMFNDLQSSLPVESEWTEGLAMRLLFLAKLASSWQSLLRQSVYYIFETAGRVDTSKPYAVACVGDVAVSLGFQSPRKLFRLFAPQLLHTWLEDQPLSDLPYDTFGFDNLQDLLIDNQSEVVAQLLMRGLDSGMQLMADTLEIEVKELLKHAFGKSVAYAISRDIVRPSSEHSSGCETRLRSIINSKEEYRQLSAEHFATIMGHFFLCMNQDDVEDGWLEKRESYPAATDALRDIKGFSYSTRALPSPQQPSFRSRYLADQMERFCRRTSQDPTAPWESATFAVAARMMFDSLDSALGSLHNCTVLRKLRLLIATAGEIAVTGYPLELLLRGVQPYLTDSQCADDALGIMKYLMRRGRRQLSTNIKFMCGVLTTLLLEIREHMGTTHEKTTQETQHRETIQKMQNFYNFGVQYMKEFRQTVGPSWHEDYDALVNALSHLELPGNARKDSPESTLLLLLVRQDSKNESLFERGDATAALAILTRNFSAPLSVNEDALVEDAACVGMAPHLWRAISSASLDGKFVLWAGKAIGRSYAASGNYNAFTIVKKAQASLTQDDNLIGAQLPYASIVRRLCDMILSPGHSESGLAEYTLRSVALKLIEDSEEEGTYKAALPELLAPVIMRGTYGYTPSALPRFDTRLADRQTLKASLATNDVSTLSEWTTGIALVLCRWRTAPFLLTALPPMLLSFPRLAMDILPAMLHMILEIESEEKQDLRPELSAAISKHLDASAETLGPKQDYLLDFILYMRRQRYPKELTKLDRLRWLEIDYMHAASAATERGKPALALMLAETSAPPVQSSRRASSRTSSVQQLPIQIPDTMLLRIFEQVDEPDSFYGVEQPASLQSVLGRLDYEKAGFKSLMFRSAQVDSHMRQSGRLGDSDALGMVRSLSALNLSSLTYALTSGQAGLTTAAATDEMLDSARKLQQWDIALPDSNADGSSRLLTLYQDLRQATKMTTAVDALNALTLEHVRSAQSKYTSLRPPHPWFSSLGMIAETLELVSCSNQTELTSIWVRMQARNSWMENARFEDFDLIQQGRITTFSVLSRNESLLKDLHITRNTMRASEVQALLSHSALARQHGQLQTALCAATQVDDLAQDLRVSGIYVDVAAKHEVASVLWGSQENSASVKMLRDTINTSDFGMQEIKVGRSGLLAQLGKQLADARLEKPSDILEHYLRPAIKELPKNAVGKEAGEVYHTFAVFCDQQLQHPANVEDYKRIITLRQRKLEEVQQLEAMFKGTRRGTASREDEQSLRKAQQWFKLDDEEFRQQKASRETFVQQSLQNYLLALHASDEHNLSVLRFFALWLESSESKPANATVSTHLPNVPSWKFVVLLNQLMSRLQSDDSAFQTTLGTLMKRLCLQHPYHSVHHVYASSKASSSGDDATASRYNAAVSIRKYVSGNQAQGNLFKRLFTANSYYRQLAEEALHDRKQGKRALKDIKTAQQVARTIPSCQVPPVTMDIPLRPDGDYSDVPVVTRFGSTVSIMSGLSTPKVLTAHSSDGQQYRQLFKSGNDDLRQDAIMEQVFEEVSKMLQNHKATRQRNLHIRTYKVIPLSSRSGIIEFVPNSIPINEFLLPAHALYGPQDMKHNSARERIRNAQSHSTETRVKEFRKVCDNFQPVMRHFFLERFDDPDDWFEKRTAYTRTTASVSMLGHVLGLGDRHGHNIMLDEVTGEVVHIDLGVAFEAGRILPIPELVPFRLTRDIVDGMGVNKTEGVFRRCCEFTMDALREDKDSIMTLLNVLRYDPLYNWTLSPLRAKRMQDAQDSMHNAKDADAAEGSKAKMAQEGGEADRALAIVEKKLSSTLSTAATVNELIQQATDEKNLATLFVGWAAWF